MTSLFSNVADKGPGTTAMASARSPGAGQRSDRATGTHLSSKGSQAVFLCLDMPVRQQRHEVEPEGRA